MPPLEWLRVFEAAARLGTFTGAATEMGLTQAAVSQRIRNLEGHLGTPLFTRLPRGVELTVEGEAYAPHVRTALFGLQRSTADLFSVSRRTLSIAASASIIELWIAPRLPALLAAVPGLQVSLTTVHRAADLASAGADIEVRFGDGAWPGRNARKLFDEVLAPVAAPGLLEAAGEDWRDLPVVAVLGPRDGWLDWAEAVGSPPRSPSARFDTFAQALAAATSGTGVLLGSLPLIEAALDSGALVRLSEASARMDAGYWLCWPPSDATYKDHAAVLDTLCEPR